MIEVTLMTQGMYGTYCIVDYGQNISEWGKAYKRNLLTDKNGKKIKLKTSIQVINYFTEKGYELIDKDSDSTPTSGLKP